MKVVPLTDFVHNAINAREGRTIEIPDSVALELERHGLVRIKLGDVDKAVSGKAADDGQGLPSSSSPPAPVSPITTSSLSKRGVTKKGKRGGR